MNSRISKNISFVVLVIIIVLFGALFYRVMSSFVLPLFLAALLVVIFRPVHQWIESRCKERAYLAAGLTTTAILLIVLIPMAWIVSLAVIEGAQAAYRFDVAKTIDRLEKLRQKLSLDMPEAKMLAKIDSQFNVLLQSDEGYSGPDPGSRDRVKQQLETLSADLENLYLKRLAIERLDYLHVPANGDSSPTGLFSKAPTRYIPVETLRRELLDIDLAGASDENSRRTLTKQLNRINREAINRLFALVSESVGKVVDRAKNDEEFSANFGYLLDESRTFSSRLDDANILVFDEGETRDPFRDLDRAHSRIMQFGDDAFSDTELPAVLQVGEKNILKFDALAGRSLIRPLDIAREELESESATADQFRRHVNTSALGYQGFRQQLLGGPVWATLKELANPSEVELELWQHNAIDYLKDWLLSITGATTARLGSVLFGFAIMTLGMFYFLAEGPAMISAVMRLSPLDDRYEFELLSEFDQISRAVVLATLLSAVAQGLLAGIGYYFAGLPSLFFLTILTMVFAMVPFVGATAIWLPACLWLAFFEEGRLVAAIILAIYGVTVVSMADNLIKPIVLHGQSKLHPLLALLSVLGGVKALGPIGILVGPMVVSFLQALLNMLHAELNELKTPET